MADDVIQLAKQYRDALARQDMRELSGLIEAYAAMVRSLGAEVQALENRLLLGTVKPSELRKMSEYRELIASATDELQRYSGYLTGETRAIARRAVERAILESRQLIALSLGDQRLVAGLRTLNPEVIETLLGFLQPSGPLYKRIGELSPYLTDKVAQFIVDFVAMGKNPRVLGRELARLWGMGLTSALRTARTVQLWSYREATRANYIANSDVVTGWMWFCSLDNSTCMSCVVQHGTIHGLDEVLDDHHNGRCTQLPVTILGAPKVESGEAWFNNLPPGEQQAMMGKGAFEAWQDGRFELRQLSVVRDDDVFGTMHHEASLKSILEDLEPVNDRT